VPIALKSVFLLYCFGSPPVNSFTLLHVCMYLFIYLLRFWGLNSGPSPWATPPALFLWRVFGDRVPRTICLSWLWTTVLLICASWVARITGMSHWCLALYLFIYYFETGSCCVAKAVL
jgi:hypothetical protein